MIDPITEACRRVRAEMVQRAGGFDAYFDQLEEMDRQRLAAQRKAGKKKPRQSKSRRKRPK